tara:strand:+ start:2177 stop:3157 length:981 start_codon:yes stop_codon:yes gene_type:complete
MKAEQIVLLDPSAVSNPSFGINPSNRSLEDLIRCGFIVIDKPPGPSSHQLAAWVRSMLGIKRIGHGGTLDPFATGLLTLLCGRSTKITSELLKKPKRYIAVLRFKESMPEDYFSEIIGNLTGDIFNVPPKESAVKIQVRSRNISESTLIQSGEKGRIHLISISCEAGTYIRTLVKDIGLISGNPCELLELHRSGSGSLEDTMACTMHQLSDAIFLWREHDDDKGLIRLISPVERILDDLPRLIIKDGAVGAISHGAPLARPGIVSMTPGVKSGSRVLLSSMKEEAVAIAELSVDSDEIPNMKSGQVATPSNVIMEPGIYPQTWSRE